MRRPLLLLSVLLGLTSLVALATTLPAAGQAPPPSQTAPSGQPPVTFKVEVNYVEVDALVSDAKGNLVSDLKKEDFQVLEDGKPQTVSTFAYVNIPIERADQPLYVTKAIEPDVQSNAREFDGRLYVLLLDDLHTSMQRTSQVKAAARRFIEQKMGANDLAAIFVTSGRENTAQSLTGNRRLLLSAIDKFMGTKLRSPTLEQIDEYNRTRDIRQQGDKVDDPLEFERGYNARLMLDTVKGVSDWMAGIRGRRKALVLVSEGLDYNIYDVMGTTYASTILSETRDAIMAAGRANVSVYSIDPRGLTAMGDEDIEIAEVPDDRSTGLGSRSLANELQLSQDSLRVLSDQTGGVAAVNANNLDDAFDRVVRESSSYYVLGYYPTNDKRDGKFRRIDVRLTRPGLTVRARKGYGAPNSKTPVAGNPAGPADWNDVLGSPIQTSGLVMSVFAAPFRGTAPNVSLAIAVEASGKDLKFDEAGGAFHDTITLSIFAIDADGKVKASQNAPIKLALKPDTYAGVGDTGVRVLTRVDVPPGQYQLRVAGKDEGTGKMGSVFTVIDVPDFSKGILGMSGVVIASANVSRAPTARSELVKDLFPIPPTTLREFRATDELAVFAEVYDNEPAKPHTVDISANVLTDDGRVVFKTQEERASEELGGKPGGYGYTTKIPLKDFAPGLYVLRVEAASRLSTGAPLNRQVQFRVKP